MYVSTQKKASWAWCEYVCARCRGDLQIALMLLRAFFPQIAHISNSPTLQFAHVFNCPHVEGLIAISPYMCVFLNVRKYTCKYTEKHHGHGVSMFTCVVGAICKSPIQRALFSGSKNC